MVKLFLTDVDGCLTDGAMYYGASGEELKRFCVYDGMGMALLMKAGVKCGILTSETTEIVARRAKKLQLDYLYMGVGSQVKQGVKTKLQVCEQICGELGIGLEEVCYVGDDINDIDILTAVARAGGIAACPPNAMPKVRAIPGICLLEHRGGEGAIRELCDEILETLKSSEM